mmetsp:Transcript_13466/g.36270  ORF Transcript_13466/g.36270 Transcript_13466/m.36270 type:complete len:269 (+) Transcript_13466:5064-5870(+)
MRIGVDVRRLKEIDRGGASGVQAIEAADVGNSAQGDAHTDLQLQRRNIDASDALGDRVLHLQARVELKEIKFVGSGLVEVLHGARAAILDRHRQTLRCLLRLTEALPRSDGGRTFFENLLEPTLGGAVATDEGDDVAIGVADELDLQVPSPCAKLHHEDRRPDDLRCHLFPTGFKLVVVLALPDALPAATLRGLQNHWVANPFGTLKRLLKRLQARFLERLLRNAAIRLDLGEYTITVPRDTRDLRGLCQDGRSDFVTQSVHHRRGGA